MAERKVAIRFDYKGDAITRIKQVETELTKLGKTTKVYQNGVLKSSTIVQKHGSRLSGLSNSLNQVALRYIGLTAALSLAQRAFQATTEWINHTVTAFREFENSMAEVSTILTGDLYENIGFLTSGVETLSIRFGKSAVDMSRGLYQILSAAIDARDALGLLNVATKASIAGLTTVETSVDVLTSILNSYGKAASQAANVSDILFQTVVRGKLRFEDLASALGYITPIAASAGVEFEEIAAALSTVTRMGLHVDMATRGLALAIQNIISPTQQASEAAAEFNVEMSAVGLQVYGLMGFIEDLNRVTKEYGVTALPRLVKNMRSLRVVLALASDEGLAGFKDDLDRVYNATGRTEEALAKMIDTQQRQAAVVEQAQERINRAIGEVWSPIQRNIEATKLWFATFIAGGLDIGKANKEVMELGQALDQNTKYMAQMAAVQAKSTTKSLFNKLFEIDDLTIQKLHEITESAIDFSAIQKYLEAQARIIPEPGSTGNYYEKLIQEAEHAAQVLENLYIGERGFGLDKAMSQEAFDTMYEQLNRLSGALDTVDIEQFGQDGVFTLQELKNAFIDIADTAELEMQDAVNSLDLYQSEFDNFFGAIDAAKENIFNLKSNIIELTYAMEELRFETVDSYKSLAGIEHAGKLGLEIDTKSFETAIDRLQSFSTIVQKFGFDYEQMFYDLMEGKTYTIGDEEISYVEAYDENLKDAINTVHQYNEAQKERLATEQAIARQIRENNLEIMRIELAGMMRRRGLTRTEEKTIKQIQIKNAELRIQEMESELKSENEIRKEQYEEATNAIEDWFEQEKFTLSLMKDARDDDLDHMQKTYDAKRASLKRYEEALSIQTRKLAQAYDIEQGLLSFLKEEYPEIANLYEQIHGIDIPDSIQKSIDAELEFIEVAKQAYEWANKTSGNKTSGGTVTTTPKAQPKEDVQKEVEKVKEESSYVDIPGIITGTRHKNPWGFARGTYSVPETGMYILHKREQVSPAGKPVGGDTFNVNISVTGNTISSELDVSKIAATIGSAMERKLMNKKTGKSRYRVI